jgi:hypothetical protein
MGHLQLANGVELLFVFLYVVRWLVLKRKYTEAQREVEKIARVRIFHGLNNYKDTKP